MMANPQWKNFQPPMQDPAILAYQPRPATHFGSPLVSNHASNNNANSLIRETGIVEKLLHSYGFIQCCERESRLFFHYSEYSGNIDTIKIGDSVEFQMCTDRKTGKPVACSIVKLDGTASFEIYGEERVTGTVVTEPKAINRRHSLTGIQDGMGRVSFERSGECFFLPFSMDDLEDGAKVKNGDNVTFFIATDKRNGNIRARKVKPLQPFKLERHEGVVCSMKDSYGFIERSDVVKEIFFHYSEFEGNINELLLGDDVEFSVAERNGKEVATEIQRLPEGTVIFEDVGIERVQGKVVKTLKSIHNRRQSDPLAGRIVYTTKTGQVEIPYGDKDQRGDYTLQCGDLVEFNVATDRRDKLQRATNIDLAEETFALTGEIRENGMVATLKEGYGFIRCATRDVRMFFHFSEALDPNRNFQLQDEVEFTVVQDPTSTNREIGIRIKHLAKGSITLKTTPEKLQGVIEREPCFHNKSPSKNSVKEPELGFILYEVNGNNQSIPYSTKDIHDIRQIPKLGDKVEFTISTDNSNKRKMAINIRILRRTSIIRQNGFIATIKDSFGFIENGDHDKEVFFHFSAFDGDPNALELGDEIEYTLSRKNSKVCAESIRKLPKGSVSPEELLPGVYEGKIIRPMRIINPDQDEYCGLVQLGHNDGPDVTSYAYGITGLADKRDFLQQGDLVKFQLCTVKSTGKVRATNIAAARKCIRATVDSMKGQFGFLNYEAEEGKKLFFHMTEVHDGAEVRSGDDVEFVVVQNQRNGKYSACSLRKISDRRRPERLISRLKSVSEDGAPKLVVIRQPKGPDGTKGFKLERSLWKPSS
ncbi:cold shock domain-containing protein E1-like [Tubulanus polymorphus]|uniref:cold shock domain-containing protein E1-like n=1 Tax=Tubulanus polymorphus TaxID=672921 RepID=UPI003DA54A73